MLSMRRSRSPSVSISPAEIERLGFVSANPGPDAGPTSFIFFFLMIRRPPIPPLFPSTTLFRSVRVPGAAARPRGGPPRSGGGGTGAPRGDSQGARAVHIHPPHGLGGGAAVRSHADPHQGGG